MIVIIVVAVLLVAGGAALVITRRERPQGPRRDRWSPPTDATDLDIPTPTIEELEALLEAPVPVLEEPAPAPEVAPEVIEKPRLRDRLGRTRNAFAGAFSRVRGRKIDDETWDELEEALLLADVGMSTTTRLLDAVRTRAKDASISEPDDLVALIRDEVTALLDGDTADRTLHAPPGRAERLDVRRRERRRQDDDDRQARVAAVADGHRVVLAAADTFRAAAADQLQLWAERTGGEIVRGQDGADPGSVVFDAMAAAGSRGADLVLVDTAGRLHTKANLMEELKKLRRIVDRTPGACKEVLLVIDASTGQNGLVQAKQFADAVDVTGIVLTKLDGTAKGGIVLAIQSELGIPVKVVGVGEGVGDLIEFDPREFAAALFEGDFVAG